MKGRKPIPRAIKILRGNPGKRKSDIDGSREAKPPATMPRRPQGMPEAARRLWDKLAPMLHKIGLLTEADGQALHAYCIAHSRWKDAEREVSKLGTVIKSPNGYPMKNPYVTIANNYYRQTKELGAELGLTPSARTRIKVDQAPDPQSELEKFLAGGTG